MDRCPVEGNWYLATQKSLAHVSPHICPGCLGFAVGMLRHCCCHGPRSESCPCGRALLCLICCWQALSASQSQPLCHVSWHCTLKVNLVHAVNYSAQQSQRCSHHSEVAAEVCFCSPLSPFLLSFKLPLSFSLWVVPCAPCLLLSPVYVPVFPFLLSPSLLSCRAPMVFPFTLPFVEQATCFVIFFFLHQPLCEGPCLGPCQWPVCLCISESRYKRVASSAWC